MKKLIKFILIVMVFVGLKIWELLKVFWKITGGLVIKHWKGFFGSIGVIVLFSGWIFLIVWQVEYFGFHSFTVILYNTIVVLILVSSVVMKDEIKEFFATNWQKAEKIVNKRIL